MQSCTEMAFFATCVEFASTCESFKPWPNEGASQRKFGKSTCVDTNLAMGGQTGPFHCSQ